MDSMGVWERIFIGKAPQKIDILILNHGIYDQSDLNSSYEISLEINALSKFKLLNLFEKTTLKIDPNLKM